MAKQTAYNRSKGNSTIFSWYYFPIRLSSHLFKYMCRSTHKIYIYIYGGYLRCAYPLLISYKFNDKDLCFLCRPRVLLVNRPKAIRIARMHPPPWALSIFCFFNEDLFMWHHGLCNSGEVGVQCNTVSVEVAHCWVPIEDSKTRSHRQRHRSFFFVAATASSIVDEEETRRCSADEPSVRDVQNAYLEIF